MDLLLDAARHRPGHLFEATLAGVLATFGRLPRPELSCSGCSAGAERFGAPVAGGDGGAGGRGQRNR